MTKITAPNRGFSGLGPAGIMFKDGVAETDNAAAIQYFRRAGYGVGGSKKPTRSGSPAPEHVFERPVPESVHLGEPLRDAAVEPLPKDYLPPTNAGLADPHGPLVVAPGIHGEPPKPIRPGDVLVDDPAAQEAAETALAEAVLVNREPVPDATAAAAVEGTPPEMDDAPSKPATGRKAAATGRKAAATSKRA